MLPQLDISVYFSQLFWLSVCVSTLIIAFKKCFIPRINRLISERNAFISQKEDNIQKLEIELRKIEDDIEALKNHGLARSSEIIREAMGKSEKSFNEQLQIIRAESDALVSSTRKMFDEKLANLGNVCQLKIDAVAKEALEKIFLQIR